MVLEVRRLLEGLHGLNCLEIERERLGMVEHGMHSCETLPFIKGAMINRPRLGSEKSAP